MKKWHKGLKVLAVVLSLFLAFPCGIVSAAAKPDIKIKHDSPKDYVPGFRITLDTEIKKKADVLVARCYFKTKKDKNLVFVDMVPKGNPGYQAMLPAPWVGSEYIEYAFVVVNKDKEVIRTQMFKMKERETAAATSWKEATEVKEIPLDKAQEAVERYEAVKKDLVREYKDRLPKHQKEDARGKLDVLTEFSNPSGQVKGFYDNMIVTTVSDSQKYGVLAEGLYTPAEIAAAGGGSKILASTGAVNAGTVKATGAIGVGTIAIAALVAGGAAAAAGGGGGGGGGSSSHSDDSSGGGGDTGVDVDDATESDFVGTFAATDPSRTYAQYHATFDFNAGGTGSVTEVLDDTTYQADITWAFDPATEVFSFAAVSSPSTFSGTPSGNTNNFTLTGVWSGGTPGTLDFIRQ